MFRWLISTLVSLTFLNAVIYCSAEDVDFTGTMVLSATKSQYDSDSTDWDSALTSAVAIESGVGRSDVTSLTVADEGGSAKVSFSVVKTNSAMSFTSISYAFTSGKSDGTLANVIQIAATDNGAVDLQSTTVTSVTITNSYPTTSSPTPAPTTLTTSHFNYLLRENYIFVAILSSIIGVFLIYWGYFGALWAYQWYLDYQDRIEAEMRAKVEAANERLTKKFHKHVDNPAPHASKMRDNFKRQFGKSAAAADGTFTASTVGQEDSDDEEQGRGKGGLQLNKVTVGVASPKTRSPGRSPGGSGGGMDGGIYSGIRKPGVQAGKSPKDKDTEKRSPGKTSPKLDLSAHARSPSILQVSRSEEDSSGFNDTAARLRQGGGARQFGFSGSPASPGKR